MSIDTEEIKCSHLVSHPEIENYLSKLFHKVQWAMNVGREIAALSEEFQIKKKSFMSYYIFVTLILPIQKKSKEKRTCMTVFTSGRDYRWQKLKC